jgi:hypothetical protein
MSLALVPAHPVLDCREASECQSGCIVELSRRFMRAFEERNGFPLLLFALFPSLDVAG